MSSYRAQLTLAYLHYNECNWKKIQLNQGALIRVWLLLEAKAFLYRWIPKRKFSLHDCTKASKIA